MIRICPANAGTLTSTKCAAFFVFLASTVGEELLRGASMAPRALPEATKEEPNVWTPTSHSKNSGGGTPSSLVLDLSHPAGSQVRKYR